MYLLDTNVISELRKPRPHGAVVDWLRTEGVGQISIPAIVIGEIQAGAEITRRQDNEKATQIESWLEHVIITIPLIAMDAPIFREWAKLMYRKSDELSSDAMIAATARLHGLVVVTRNVKDFAAFGVKVFNPFNSRKGERS